MIFNGTQQRKALNVAKVSLTFSNEQAVLALDVAEISVKRRPYCLGENEYFNNNPVRLKEIQELFYDIGVGKAVYFVMEQGRIDQILLTKPEEYLFEEATDVTQFKLRRQEAERKLEKDQENIRQIESILKEVQKNHEALKQQAQKADAYRGLPPAILELEKNIQLLKWQTSHQCKDILEAEQKELTEKRARLHTFVDSINQTTQASLSEINQLEAGLVDQQKRLYGLELERKSLEKQIQLQSQLAHEAGRDQALKEKLVHLNNEMAQKQADRQELEKALQDCQIYIAGFGKSIGTIRTPIQDNLTLIRQHHDKMSTQESQDLHLLSELRLVTNRLVDELDRYLKKECSWSNLLSLRSKIDRALSSIFIFLEGRQELLQDIVLTGKFSDSNPKLFIKKLVANFQQIRDRLAQLPAWRKGFQKAVLESLGDFLSPKGIVTQKSSLEKMLEEERIRIKTWKDQIEDFSATNSLLDQRGEESCRSLEQLKFCQVRMKTQLSFLEENKERVCRELCELQRLINGNDQKHRNNQTRLEKIAQEIFHLQSQLKATVKYNQKFRQKVQFLETSLVDKQQVGINKESEIKIQRDELAQTQFQIEKKQRALTQVFTEILSLCEYFQDKHSVDPLSYQNQVHNLIEDMSFYKEQLNTKKDQMKELGQVNLMAFKELKEVDARSHFLSQQLPDLKKAKEDLQHVTQEIQRESTQLFEKTFLETKLHFNTVFRRLFGGGRADLKLRESKDVLQKEAST